MKPSDHHDWPREILDDAELQSLRESSLADGLAALRVRRRRRALGRAALVVAPVCALITIWGWPRPGEVTMVLRPVVTVAAVPAVAAGSATVKIYPAAKASEVPPVPTISDDELLAMFADQPVGLLGEPGRQHLVAFNPPATKL